MTRPGLWPPTHHLDGSSLGPRPNTWGVHHATYLPSFGCTHIRDLKTIMVLLGVVFMTCLFLIGCPCSSYIKYPTKVFSLIFFLILKIWQICLNYFSKVNQIHTRKLKIKIKKLKNRKFSLFFFFSKQWQSLLEKKATVIPWPVCWLFYFIFWVRITVIYHNWFFWIFEDRWVSARWV